MELKVACWFSSVQQINYGVPGHEDLAKFQKLNSGKEVGKCDGIMGMTDTLTDFLKCGK